MPVKSTPQTSSAAEISKPTVTELQNLYEDGKHRQYSLMFAINGGAFAVAQQMKPGTAGQALVLGSLSLRELSAGLAPMTFIMGVDIFFFGRKLRKDLYDYESQNWR